MKVDKPWGWYYNLTPATTVVNHGYLAKELHVNKGHRLSLQRHQHRCEHWVVVKGEGLFECDGHVQIIKPGMHVYIPKRSVHRLTAQDQDIRIVEVQLGDLIFEDDIERLEDDYAR